MKKFIEWVIIGFLALTALCIAIAILAPTPVPKANESTEAETLVPKTPLSSTITKRNLPSVSVSQKQALEMAKDYLEYSAFSRRGLISQLEYEGFSKEDATYGVDACNADWMEQASLKAKDYLEYSAFSRSGLISQLEYEKFSKEEATYGVDANNVNWMEQASLKAKEYLEYSAFSRSGLISQLQYEGFTIEQATFGVNSVGL